MTRAGTGRFATSKATWGGVASAEAAGAAPAATRSRRTRESRMLRTRTGFAGRSGGPGGYRPGPRAVEIASPARRRKTMAGVGWARFLAGARRVDARAALEVRFREGGVVRSLDLSIQSRIL